MKKNYLSLLILAGAIASASSAFAATRGQIIINGDTEFTAANGVANPGATGTLFDPYYIQDWSIDMAGHEFPVCILLQGTTKYVVIRRNTCVNANVGMALNQAANATFSTNNISKIRAGDSGFPAIGIYAFFSKSATISDNTISDVNGYVSNYAAWGVGLQGTTNSKVLRNNISRLYGAKGDNGVNGSGDSAFPGGNAEGIHVDSIGAGETNILVQGNKINSLYGAFGGNGGSGPAGVDGGDAGDGGSAYGVFVKNLKNVTVLGNIVSSLYASNGGIGGLGGSGGGKGGKGGKGGSAEALSFDTSTALIINNNNVLTALRGGVGGRGGAGSGGTGGNGGNGGNGAGIHYLASSGFSHFGNSITNFLGGAGGIGGTPGGANGTAGKTTAILVD